MQKTRSGFTIVELLIVIVVIAILAAISVVAYTGVQTRAENTKTVNGVAQYVKILMSYKATNGDYPAHSDAPYACLGTGYTSNVCSTDTDGTTAVGINSPLLNQALSSVSNLPQLSTKTLSMSNGQLSAGGTFRYNERMIRYHLQGASQPCVISGAIGYNYGSVTQCRIVLE